MSLSLQELREEIDRIDDALHDLFVRRAEVVHRIGALKAGDGGRPAMRPAREAQVLRRLVGRRAAAPGGARLPGAVLVRIWRELLAAMTRIQEPLSIAVCAPPEDPGYRDLARDHFGSLTPMTAVPAAGQALRTVAGGAATAAVVPLPQDEAEGVAPWWLALFPHGEDRLRVIALLPFGAPAAGPGAAAGLRALAVGRFGHEPSGDDATVLAVEAEPTLSRGRLGALLDGAGLAPGWSAAWRPPAAAHGAPTLHLVEVLDFVGEDDPRLDRLLEAGRGEVVRATPAGGYARPLSADALA